MTRAVLVAGLLAAAALPPAAALGAPAGTAASTTFVVRGVVVQYIPPSGSVVGSLSIRVVKVGAHGRALLGELITVAVERSDAPKKGQLKQKSVYTLTLKAASPASILKGAADVRSIVPGGPTAPVPASGSAPGNPPANPDAPGKSDSAGASTGSNTGGDSSDHGSSQSTDHGSGQGDGDHGSGEGSGDHSSGQGNDSGAGSQGRGGGGGGGSSGHK